MLICIQVQSLILVKFSLLCVFQSLCCRNNKSIQSHLISTHCPIPLTDRGKCAQAMYLIMKCMLYVSMYVNKAKSQMKVYTTSIK